MFNLKVVDEEGRKSTKSDEYVDSACTPCFAVATSIKDTHNFKGPSDDVSITLIGVTSLKYILTVNL